MSAVRSSYGAAALGTTPAIVGRLKAARNRLAGAITAELRGAETDARAWDTQDASLRHEREALEEARRILCRPAPMTFSAEERMHRKGAMEAGLTIHGERSHGEAWR
jgi:dihydroxyacetone kinase